MVLLFPYLIIGITMILIRAVTQKINSQFRKSIDTLLLRPIFKFMSKTYSYSGLHRALEIISIFLFLGSSFLISLKIFFAINSLTSVDLFIVPLFLLLPCILGYISADFISGMVHFLADTFGGINTPFLGQSFIGPFREHHVDPKGITRHDFIETNGNNCIVTFPIVLIYYYFARPELSMYHLGTSIFFLTLVLAIFLTNQFHKWAHLDNPNLFIRLLQKSHLILSIPNHSVHHTIPFDKYYCITSGWLNPFLEKIGFFKKLKALIIRITSALKIKIQVVG